LFGLGLVLVLGVGRERVVREVLVLGVVREVGRVVREAER